MALSKRVLACLRLVEVESRREILTFNDLLDHVLQQSTGISLVFSGWHPICSKEI